MAQPARSTAILSPERDDIARAGEILRRGALVAFPTETVYGLGADARNDAAVAGIYAAKGRPGFNPLIVHVPDLAAARQLAIFDTRAERLARAFWPGALTLVLPLAPESGLSPRVTAGLDTVAIRVPANALARALLEQAGVPVAAPSANPSGRISPTRAEHVLAGLGGRIDAVLDGGATRVGVESTIVGLAPGPELLRPGGVAVEPIETALGEPLLRPGSAALEHPAAEADPAPVRAPGQLGSHYAPRARLRLDAHSPRPGERLLGFGPEACGADLNLSPAGNLEEAAANLFDYLHRLDAAGSAPIAVSPIPQTGLGRAINDRLRRAAAPRE